MGILIKIPYIKQPKNSSKCGAICASMLIEYYAGKKVDVDLIWENVKSFSPELNREYCRTNKVGKFINDKYFNCCIIRYNNLKDLLLFCNENVIAPILNHKSFTDKKGGHFSIVKNISNDCVIVSDPEYSRSDCRSLTLLSKLCEKYGPLDEVGGNTVIVPIMNNFDYQYRICPYCGEKINISFSRAANQKMPIVLEELCLDCDRYSSEGVVE